MTGGAAKMLWMILAASLAGGILSVLLAAAVLWIPAGRMEKLLPRLISFSTGALLGAALLGMIPHASEELPGGALALVLLLGLIGFFVLEKLLIWRHCHRHGGECDVHASSGPLLLIGDAFHNFVDGVVIAGAFLASLPLGLTVALSAIAHEVPQEVGEFMVYLHAGYGRRRALALNMLTSLTSVLGALMGFFLLSEMRGVLPYLLSVAAAGFIYVALADLVPAQRGRTTLSLALLDFTLLGLGVGVVALMSHAH
jgi:zinc and cadmium transporter